jgi:signal transduction histidine kinase
MYTWSADEKPFPPGWPNQALALSEQLDAAERDNLTIPDVAALSPGPVKETLEAAGVSAWACVPLVRPGRAQSIMGFDRFRPIRGKIHPVPIVRLAGDAVANAVEREFLERERVKLTTRLERARRMQMVGSLASGIAHNFNNIIGAILGYSSRNSCAEPSQRSKLTRYAGRRSVAAIWSTISSPSGGGPTRVSAP